MYHRARCSQASSLTDSNFVGRAVKDPTQKCQVTQLHCNAASTLTRAFVHQFCTPLSPKIRQPNFCLLWKIHVENLTESLSILTLHLCSLSSWEQPLRLQRSLFQTAASFSSDVSGGFSFGGDALVVLTVKESYARDHQLAAAIHAASRKKRRASESGLRQLEQLSPEAAARVPEEVDAIARRRRRSLPPLPDRHTVSVRLRTDKNSGVVYFAGSTADYFLLQVLNCEV